MAQVKGVSFQFIFEDDNGAEVIVQGQKSASLERNTDTEETTTKDSNGFKSYDPQYKDWSVEFEGAWTEGDTAYALMEDYWLANKKFKVKIASPTGNKYQGIGFFTSLPLEFPHDASVTYSGSVQGDGELEKILYTAPVEG